MRGDFSVRELPNVWAEKMEAYLDVQPDDDIEGCLQDSHWAYGSFGYFPTYSLGSILAAQFYAAADEAVEDLDRAVRAGDVEPLREWLYEHVARHGQRYSTPGLIEQATGEALTPEYYLDYAETKFIVLYRI